MAEFLNLEAIDEDNEGDDDDEYVSDGGTVSDNNFIDDSSIFDEPYEDLYMFENVTRNMQDALNDTLLCDY